MMVNELTDSEAAFHIGQWHAAFAAFGALGFAKLGQVLQVGEAFLERSQFFCASSACTEFINRLHRLLLS